VAETDPGGRAGTARAYLVRHGETEWSITRRHTGRTDLPLTEGGRRRAAELRETFAGRSDVATAVVLTSPLLRARQTCELAGLGDRAEVDDDLVEWDYGEFEGTQTADLRTTDPTWSIWTTEVREGESLASVAARADQVVRRLDEIHRSGRPAVVFAHAHLLRILGARWCGFPAAAGAHLTLEPASISVLGYERETRVIEHWNAADFPH
jgi:probable phosphoglycerate mutase